MRNPFPPELHKEVIDRDRICFLYRMDPDHTCRTRFGFMHGPGDKQRLEVDHVKQQLALGIPKKHKIWLLVAMCGAGNARPPTKETRQAERAYLAMLYPSEWKQAL